MKKITKKELDIILKKHKIWIDDNSKGERADLSELYLSNHDLSGLDLAFANLSGADLYFANLTGANLSFANLHKADLSYANLYKADLSNVNLTDANLACTKLLSVDLSDLANFDFIFKHTITDKKYYQLIGIGSREGITTYCVNNNWIYCGCWNDYRGGTLEEFEERIEKIYGKCGEKPNKKYYKEYMDAIKYFKLKKIKST